ncbi:class I SAM-dependent methyltransferase [Variovorax sp. CCNWLW235]|uniref:class I SAM-dependent methyltransferase n=1 Tax=Variovorax sp. CCNWLW235 TaxID=3127463 RepID=UPI0030780E28
MKAQLRKIARKMAGWPVLGRFVRIGIAVIRLPEANHRKLIFETQQLPGILQAISEINHRQLTSVTAKDNLTRSVPVALRNITRASKALEQDVRATDGRLDTVSQSMSEARAQIEGMTESIQYLLQRTEFVRSELMFEMRYGAGSSTADQRVESSDEIQPRVVAEEKVSAAKAAQALRVNLGCGHVPLAGYLNVDSRDLPGVDIVAEVGQLPFAPGELSEVFSAHLLEHFPQEKLRRVLLPYWFSLLRVGGTFKAIVPDAAGMVRAYASNEYTFDNFRQVTFGGQDYNGDFHFNMFTSESMRQLLLEAGFIDVEVIAENRENGGCKEFEITARRGQGSQLNGQ